MPADLRSHVEVREHKVVLGAPSDGELHARARQAGVPYSEVLHAEPPDQPGDAPRLPPPLPLIFRRAS